jgi:hypothetical protein
MRPPSPYATPSSPWSKGGLPRRAALFAIAVLASACGRKATEGDCQLIIDRNVEVQMRAMNITDSVLIAKKQQEIREQLKGEMKECVGRRVTDGMMNCVRIAADTKEIASCMR